MASFNETRVPTAKKYVVEQVLLAPNWLKIFETFWPHSSVFALEEQPEKLNFWSFVYLYKKPLVISLIETRAPTSRKYVVDQGIAAQNWSKILQSFWSHSSVLALKKQPSKAQFSEFSDA